MQLISIFSSATERATEGKTSHMALQQTNDPKEKDLCFSGRETRERKVGNPQITVHPY